MGNTQTKCAASHHNLTVLQGRGRALFALDEVKRYLRVDFACDDTQIDSLIAAATNHVEQHLGRTLLKTRYKLDWRYCRSEQYLDYFVVHLPMGPVISVEKVLAL